MMRLSLLLFSFSLFILSVKGQSDTGTTLLSQAQDALRSQDYATAIQVLEDARAQGYASADLYYNLGLAYYRTGALGQTRLAWERGLRLRPHHADLRHNTQLLLREHPDGMQPMPNFFLRAWWMAIAGLFPPLVWTVLGLLLLWAGAGALVVYLAGKTQRRRSIISTGILLMALSILPFMLALTRQSGLENQRRVVLVADEVVLHAAPNDTSTEQAVLHGGWKARILDEYNDWQKLRLEDGQEGWVPRDVVERI